MESSEHVGKIVLTI